MLVPYPTVKRCFDVLAAAVLGIATLPVTAGVAVVVRIALGSPVLFRQTRLGRFGESFTIYKFRSMADLAGPDGRPRPDAERLGRVGVWLRRLSLDELPQLINVAQGSMSFVGPRPLLPEYAGYYTEREASRHLVRPGLTGLAQINGRNYLAWDDRLDMDARYVETMSFGNDLRIVLATVSRFMKGSGVAAVPADTGGRLDVVRSERDGMYG